MNQPSYVATKETLFLYPRAGDPVPPGGAKVLILTNGGICTIGQWANEPWCVGWHPLPGRDRTKEDVC